MYRIQNIIDIKIIVELNSYQNGVIKYKMNFVVTFNVWSRVTR